MMASGDHIKINQEFRTDIFSSSKTHIINRVLPRGGVRGRISGGVGWLNHIWQVGVPIMTALLWGLSGKRETHTHRETPVNYIMSTIGLKLGGYAAENSRV